jgi:glutamate 5-kinase
VITRKQAIERARRVVIKIGSTVITSRSEGVDRVRITRIAECVARLVGVGIEPIIVTSGAVSAGMSRLGLNERPRAIEQKQACAAVGQSALMRIYEKSFSRHNIGVGQMLLTSSDLMDRRRFLNARNTLQKLIEYGVIPIINENDTVSVEELKFSDNDNLAALVTNLAEADTLVILSDVDGLYDKDPANADAKLITEIGCITPEVEGMAGSSCSIFGTGGMSSKLGAAKKAVTRGASCFIISGKIDGNIKALFDLERCGDGPVGTYIMPGESCLTSKKHWIAFSMAEKGRLIIDDGAANAITKKGTSLLPSGIKSVEGRFSAGDAVAVCLEDGRVVARGLVRYGYEEADKIKGVKTADIERVLGYKYSDEVVHRDDLVVM